MSDHLQDLIPHLTTWMASRRWYAGKGRTPRLRHLGAVSWPAPGGAGEHVLVRTHLVCDDSGSAPVVYQVPLTYRRDPEPALHAALVTTVGEHHVYDACHDRAYVQALLDLVQSGSTVGSGSDASAMGHPVDPTAPRPVVARSAVLTGEQSNTSVIVDLVRPADREVPGQVTSAPLIVKVFRVLQEGDNPDVAVQSALAEAGSTLVPRPTGYVAGTWTSPGGGQAHGHLAFAQEFLPGVQDAWRTALVAAQADEDFTERAHALGLATAQVHGTLREALGTEPVTDAHRDSLVGQWHTRCDTALEEVPELVGHRAAVDQVYRAAASGPWPDLQRIHGDYHLGQVLDVPGRGWVLVDFEGEPLRSLAERSAPDLALRDVAGMLRSFDYAAGSVDQEHDLDRLDWANAARAAFLAGYAQGDGRDPRELGALLDALELDKALYEVVYESRNRPSWVGIPVSAITRLLQRRDHSTSDPAPSTEETTVSDPKTPQAKPLHGHEVELLLRGQHSNPHGLLGAHPHDGGLTVRVLRPLASKVDLVLPGERRVQTEHETHGVWTAVLPTDQVSDYRVETTWGDGVAHLQDDPYRFLPTLGEIDQHLINEGRHEQLWTVLGAHVRSYDGPLGHVVGTSFAVWAPNAQGVNLVGDFNHWDNASHPMRMLGSSGIWELFVPDTGAGTRYKYDITGPDGHRRMKADPMARATEVPPSSASIVTEATHVWGDDAWVEQRDATSAISAPMSVYEVHLASWRQGLSYRELADQLVDYVTELGFTHVELMPVMQHPYGPSWGYHVTGYYAADARFGSPEDLKFLIDRLHQAGVGVILDWVPGHFATDPWALGRFDGTPIYEHPDPRKGWHTEWGSYVFDFGRPQVRNFLVANALFWLEEFHADGLRVDGVASMLYLDYSREEGQWIPNRYGGRENLEAVEVLQETNATAYRRHPGAVIIAEESTSWPGVTKPTDQNGLGFGFKWNMGWMNDSLDYIAREPIHRQYHHHQMTFAMMYAFSENYVLPISHDEVVHGKGSLLRKMPGDRWQQLANLRAYLAFMWAHPGKQLLFMGSEFGQETEWADGRSLDWWLLNQPAHLGIAHMVRDLNAAYRAHPALWQLDSDASGFQWLDADDAQGNTYSFVRYGSPDDDGERPMLVALTNFGGAPRDVRVGLPRGGRWREVLNTDAHSYGGSGVGNLGVVTASDEPHQGQPHSATLVVPPLGAVWLAPENGDAARVGDKEA
ncbi:1,4-alpha-glucan branching protein GlgB [Ornithinimicrobium sediminis]|uniref:1,4-alpha-glucan branching protein GlgB n=1 Tax=Ornithinimicrobium sediminis TaxID=2904603 RepID=UPI001E3E3ACE|nr:1,4-alpha-glucan branching protein GlgB [Ornithinimicrobium sediminis]